MPYKNKADLIALCHECHATKTAEERDIATERKRREKNALQK